MRRPVATKGKGHGKGHIERNAGQIFIYLDELLPILEPSGGVPETPMNRKERGASRPPVSPHIMELWMANPWLGRVNPILKRAASLETRNSEDILGFDMSEILDECLYDHTAIRRWKAEEGLQLTRFNTVCRLLAQRLSKAYDGPGGAYIIFVHLEPEDRQEKSLRHAGRRPRQLKDRDSYRKIVASIEGLEAQGYSREAAKSKKARDLDCSYWRIEKAITFVNRERAATPEEAS